MNENGADIVLKCGFQSVNFKTVFSNNKGENLAKSGHVINVTEVIASYNEALSKTDLPQQWGKPSKAGEDKYKKGKKISDLFSIKTVRAGLTIHSKYPWLCASPDALVLSQNGNINKILEIKYPISFRNKLIFDEDSKKCNLSYLKYENDEIVLKSFHQYYTQCQIIMFVTGPDKKM
ncbi:SWIM-type domain-containing protein [Aphis craccivora]|uniref:SWIM-type domain-containing protein n=1 Tax=Aphis craccivora TaxID=307492 RepID=A0A6G0ZCI7_APHCR|nr:SWIM-type domain-containing protein [Aphis craccivora]